MSRGFRSAFNFVREGDYRVTPEFREFLTKNEVGVHDLRHDGKLYWSREVFRRNADGINRYMRDWKAGFRSGFMKYDGQFRQALPKQVAALAKETLAPAPVLNGNGSAHVSNG